MAASPDAPPHGDFYGIKASSIYLNRSAGPVRLSGREGKDSFEEIVRAARVVECVTGWGSREVVSWGGDELLI